MTCLSSIFPNVYLSPTGAHLFAVALSLMHGRAPGAYIMFSVHLWMEEYVVSFVSTLRNI